MRQLRMPFLPQEHAPESGLLRRLVSGHVLPAAVLLPSGVPSAFGQQLPGLGEEVQQRGRMRADVLPAAVLLVQVHGQQLPPPQQLAPHRHARQRPEGLLPRAQALLQRADRRLHLLPEVPDPRGLLHVLPLRLRPPSLQQQRHRAALPPRPRRPPAAVAERPQRRPAAHDPAAARPHALRARAGRARSGRRHRHWWSFLGPKP
mmetsp:Transcript_45265/g.113861  ORF Transcript_45265/g.113861 Transcript_45265/m.113861 type:complete len:204 (-) Transcript_45265:64-675(-)